MRTIYTLLILFVSIAMTAQVEDCNPPSSQSELNINNVRATVSNGLQHYENNGFPAYQVPKVDLGEDGANVIYSDGLWIAGYDGGGQLHLAATTYPYPSGGEYSAGPLQANGLVDPDQTSCNFYDNVYRAERADAILHHEYFTRVAAVAGGADPSILTDPPFENGYTIPDYFYTWPAMNYDVDYDLYLAPFYDWDQDGVYQPDEGDYPGFDLSGIFDCQNQLNGPNFLLGHQATWYVSNDLRTHASSGGEALGLEVQVMNYAYVSDDALNDATFTQYTIINRSQNTYSDCVISKWVDPDVGCPDDDFFGTEVARGLIYGYNGDNLDEDCLGQVGYGEQLAAIGVKLISGPLQDVDGTDNPLTTDVSEAINADGIVYEGQGKGYGDGIIDNEQIGTRSSVTYSRNDQTPTPSTNGEPNGSLDFVQFMNSNWKNGMPITHGGNGVGGALPTDYMYPGTSDPLGAATAGAVLDDNWSEATEGFLAGDRRAIMSTSAFTIEPGEVNVLTYAYIWAQDVTGETDALENLFTASDLIDSYYDNCFSEVPEISTGLEEEAISSSLVVWPNPSSDEITIQLRDIASKIQGIRIIDISGNQVQIEHISSGELQRIDVSDLSSGLYLLQVTTEAGAQGTRSFIKE